MKIVLIRLDKIGDLVSTLPVDQCEVLRNLSSNQSAEKSSSKTQIKWVIAKGLGFVADHAEPKREFIELDKSHWKSSLQQLREFLRHEKPDVAISFQAPWWVNFALWIEKVPRRAGVLSQWHSFLFLNKALRQKRSLAQKHEADYNADLLYHALDESERRKIELRHLHSRYHSPYLKLNSSGDVDLLSRYRLTPQKFVVVHAGMMGSARNWPSEKWISLIHLILKDSDLQVVLTGTPADEPYVSVLKTEFANQARVVVLQNQLNSLQLLSVLQTALAVVAPSTGVLHLAAALEVRAIGIYSPIRVQQSTRWGARGLDVKIFEPHIACPEAFSCSKEKCPHWDCMQTISDESVFAQIKELI